MNIAEIIIKSYEASVLDIGKEKCDDENTLLVLKYFYLKLKNLFSDSSLTIDPLVIVSIDTIKPHKIIEIYLDSIGVGIDEKSGCSVDNRRINNNPVTLNEIIISNINYLLSSASKNYKIIQYENYEFKKFKVVGDKAMTNLIELQSAFRLCNNLMLDVVESMENR